MQHKQSTIKKLAEHCEYRSIASLFHYIDPVPYVQVHKKVFKCKSYEVPITSYSSKGFPNKKFANPSFTCTTTIPREIAWNTWWTLLYSPHPHPHPLALSLHCHQLPPPQPTPSPRWTLTWCSPPLGLLTPLPLSTNS
jgi:hypothetical protein